MPWKETDVVEMRSEFVMRAMRGEQSFVALCREYGISAKTGYKWKERFEAEGLGGLRDQSKRPRSSPQQISEDQVCLIVKLKRAHQRWGPKKIRELLSRKDVEKEAASLSTVKRVLKKAGLVEARGRRQAQECGRIENRLKAEAPNDVWTTDFKGHWYSAERKRVQPLTVQDAYSRYVLCAQALPDSRTETVRKCFERVFECYGLPRTIRSDNGTPFASTNAPLGLSQLSAWWVSLGINLDRIRPGHPEENGGHERMHRDLSLEVEQSSDGSWDEQAAELEVWRRERNEERPHESLGMRTPAEVYKKSERNYEGDEEVELEYPSDYLKRKVSSGGEVRVAGARIRISEAIAKWDIGLKAVGPRSYAVWFGPLCLGALDLETEVFKAM